MTQSSRDRPLGETSGTDQRPARRLADSVMGFDLNAELASLRQEPAFQRGDRDARTLVEEPGFRVVLTALKAGTHLREHRTAGRVSIQTVAGHLQVRTNDRVVDLPAGRLIALDREVPHDVEAVEESAFLLTMAGETRASGA